jgi:hypothetical protein
MIKLTVDLAEKEAMSRDFILQDFKLLGLSTWLLFLIVLNVKG